MGHVHSMRQIKIAAHVQTYPQAPYYEGRWSNGPVWIEVAAQQLGVRLTDFAAAGATSGVVPARAFLPPYTQLAPTFSRPMDSALI